MTKLPGISPVLARELAVLKWIENRSRLGVLYDGETAHAMGLLRLLREGCTQVGSAATDCWAQTTANAERACGRTAGERTSKLMHYKILLNEEGIQISLIECPDGSRWVNVRYSEDVACEFWDGDAQLTLVPYVPSKAGIIVKAFRLERKAGI